MSDKTGGSAFPVQESNVMNNGERAQYAEPGMTLRDYFAAKSTAHLPEEGGFSKDFIEAYMGKPMPHWKEPECITYMMEFNAKMKYADADAMLKQREL